MVLISEQIYLQEKINTNNYIKNIKNIFFDINNYKIRKIYTILDKFILQNNINYTKELNILLKKNIKKNINNCVTNQNYNKLINNLLKDKIYNYYYCIDIKNAYESINLNILFQVIKKYYSSFIKYDNLKKHCNNIYSNIEIKYNRNQKTLFLGIPTSKILFNILLTHILNIKKLNSKIYYYYDDILLCNDNKIELKNEINIIKETLSIYMLEINENKSKLIDINKNNLFWLNNVLIKNKEKNYKLLDPKNILSYNNIYKTNLKIKYDNNKSFIIIIKKIYFYIFILICIYLLIYTFF